MSRWTALARIQGLAAFVVLVGCAAPAPSSAPLASMATSSLAPPPAAPEGSPVVAELVPLEVVGSGTVGCMYPHGCLASFAIGPAGWTPDAQWEPAPTDPVFVQTLDPKTLERGISGPLERGPTTIEAGRHTLVAAVSERSDLIIITPDDPSPDPGFLWTETCSLGVDVSVTAPGIRVEVVFQESRCEMSVTQE